MRHWLILQVEQIEHWTDLPESVRAEVGSAHGFLCQKPQVLLVKPISSLLCFQSSFAFHFGLVVATLDVNPRLLSSP